MGIIRREKYPRTEHLCRVKRVTRDLLKPVFGGKDKQQHQQPQSEMSN